MESFEPATLLRTVAYRVGPSACHAGLLDKLSGSHASYTLECTVIALGKTAIVFSRQARFSAFRRLHERMLAELERDEPCGARHHCDVPPLPASRPLALVQDRRFCEQRALELTAWFNSVAAGKNATGLALESAALFSFLGGCSLIERMRARADEIHLAQVIAAGNRRRMGGQALRACIERAALAAHAHEIGAAPSDVAPAGPVEAHAPLSLVLCAQQDFCAGSTEAQRATHADDASSSSSRATARALLDDVDGDAHDEPALSLIHI